VRKKSILFIANHRLARSPGQRFRFEQYIPFLEENGFHCELSHFISENDDKLLYRPKKWINKAKLARKAWDIRKKDLARAEDFDIIFIYREALLTRSTRFERLLSKNKAKVVFDFDDAIWLPNVSAANRTLQFLKNPSKINKVLPLVDLVFAGNQYLADYAKQFNDQVEIIPTTIDLNYHQTKKVDQTRNQLCIGWTGTQTNLRYLDELVPVFKQLKLKFGDELKFKIICDTPWQNSEVEVENVAWSKEDEINQLDEIDIGIMPLTDDEWSQGKCGFKALQFMALKKAVVVSPVGVNAEIVKDKKNGFWAKTSEDWFRSLSLLIEDRGLRKSFGEEGYQTVKANYSVEAYKKVYLKLFNKLIENKSEKMKETALTKVHKELGAKMAPFAGYEMPIQYSGLTDEHMAVRESVGVFDVSHMGEFMVRGPQALDLIQKISTNDASKLFKGKVQYSCMPNGKGGIVDDLLIYQTDDQEYLLVVNASNIKKDWDWIQQNNDFDAQLEDISDKITLLAIQGPKTAEAMQALTDVKLDEMKYYTFEKGSFAGVDDVIISATGYTGSGGFEIYFDNADAEKIWNAVMEAGKGFGIKPAGLGARDTLRLEKGFCLYGNDIDDTTSPIEAGLGWITKFTKDFIDSDRFKKQKEEGVSRKLVAFKMIDRGIPRQDYKILDASDNELGVVTSGTSSPSLKVGIGMGYVKKENSKVGENIFIEVRNKQLKAEIVKLPFV
jgi:aminomethyltransferase